LMSVSRVSCGNFLHFICIELFLINLKKKEPI
jgi:hypothetical protein